MISRRISGSVWQQFVIFGPFLRGYHGGVSSPCNIPRCIPFLRQVQYSRDSSTTSKTRDGAVHGGTWHCPAVETHSVLVYEVPEPNCTGDRNAGILIIYTILIYLFVYLAILNHLTYQRSIAREAHTQKKKMEVLERKAEYRNGWHWLLSALCAVGTGGGK